MRGRGRAGPTEFWGQVILGSYTILSCGRFSQLVGSGYKMSADSLLLVDSQRKRSMVSSEGL